MEDYIFLAITAIIGVMIQFDVVKRWKYRWALEIIQLAVSSIYNEFVKPAKAAAENGKLSEDQRVEARRKAIEKAKVIAKDRGIDLNAVLGNELLEMYVQLAVSKVKAGR